MIAVILAWIEKIIWSPKVKPVVDGSTLHGSGLTCKC
jgi:hypothetical protein